MASNHEYVIRAAYEVALMHVEEHVTLLCETGPQWDAGYLMALDDLLLELTRLRGKILDEMSEDGC